jgi:hypothetical protein
VEVKSHRLIQFTRLPTLLLGLRIEQSEGAKFALKVFNELKARGVNDILIAVVDSLKALGVPANGRADPHCASNQEQLGACIVEGSRDARLPSPGRKSPRRHTKIRGTEAIRKISHAYKCAY